MCCENVSLTKRDFHKKSSIFFEIVGVKKINQFFRLSFISCCSFNTFFKFMLLLLSKLNIKSFLFCFVKFCFLMSFQSDKKYYDFFFVHLVSVSFSSLNLFLFAVYIFYAGFLYEFLFVTSLTVYFSNLSHWLIFAVILL